MRMQVKEQKYLIATYTCREWVEVAFRAPSRGYVVID